MSKHLLVDEYGRLVVDGTLIGGSSLGPIIPPLPNLYARAAGWPLFLHALLLEFPTCWGCGRKSVTGHHKVPFHIDRSKELLKSNILIVCLPCHFVICHCGDWRLWVKTAKIDLTTHFARVQTAEQLLEPKHQ